MSGYLQSSFRVTQINGFKLISGVITDLEYLLEVHLREDTDLDTIMETEKIEVSGFLIVVL